MEFQIKWLAPGRVLFVRKVGEETLESLKEGNQRIFAKIEEEGEPPVHVVIDPRQMIGHPDMRQAQAEFNRLLKHPKIGWALFADADRLPAARKALGALLTRLAGMQWKSVSSEEEALTFLRGVDMRLADLDVAAAVHKVA